MAAVINKKSKTSASSTTSSTPFKGKQSKPPQQSGRTSEEQRTIRVVEFQKYLFPADAHAWSALQKAGVRIFRMTESVIGLLKATKALSLPIEKVPFNEVWRPFNEKFRESLAKLGEVKVNTEFETMLLQEDPSEEDRLHLNELIKNGREFMQRFCVRLRFDSKDNDEGASLHKIRFHYDAEISNGYAFASDKRELAQTTNNLSGISRVEIQSTEMLLTPAVMLRFTISKTAGVPTFEVSLLDKLGDTWSESMRRTGKYSAISKDGLTKVAMMLATLGN